MQPVKEIVYDEICPVRTAMEMIGGKWKIPIVWAIHQLVNPRYNQLQRFVVGITNTMLAKTLKELERDGLVHRKQFNEIPPHVEYTLTAKAEELVVIIGRLGEWAKLP